MALQGDARVLCEDIDVLPAGVAAAAMPGVEAALDLMEARFCPPGDSDVMRVDFRSAKQEPGEPVQIWMGRCRSLFVRAHPNIFAADVDGQRYLIDQFILGMADPYMKTRTWERRPATLADAGNFAVNLAAGQQILSKQDSATRPAANAIDAQVSAVGNPCFFCKRTNHLLKECRDFALYKKKYEEDRIRKGGKKASFGRGKFQGSFQWKKEEGAGRGRAAAAAGRRGRGAGGRGRSASAIDRSEELLRKLSLENDRTVSAVQSDDGPRWSAYDEDSAAGNE